MINLFPGLPAILEHNVDIKISVFQSGINISLENEAPRASKSDYVLWWQGVGWCCIESVFS